MKTCPRRAVRSMERWCDLGKDSSYGDTEKWSAFPDIEETSRGISDWLNMGRAGGEIKDKALGSALGTWANNIIHCDRGHRRRSGESKEIS